MDLSNIDVNKKDFKRERKHNAIKLPEAIKHEIIPKYVTYYRECYNVERKLYREFFKIEKHPLQKKNKVYVSSKSNKMNILEKLEQIKKILESLNNCGENKEINNGKKGEIEGENNENNKIDGENNGKKEEIDEENNENNENNKIEGENKEKLRLPKYISLRKHEKDDNKYYLIYDKKTQDSRISLKTICTKLEPFSQNLNQFLEKIENKYNNTLINQG